MINQVTRREILLCVAAVRLYGADAEFWNRKDPSEWSADEIDRMITKSPWAKEITASTPQGTVGGRGRGGLSIPGRRSSPAAGRGAAQFNGVVRWESAKPILAAMKTPLPGEFSDHYTISVSGIPLTSLGSQNFEGTDAEVRARQRQIEGVLDRIKGLTYLEPGGAATAQPGIVQETPFGVGETRTLLFGFSKSLLQLSPDDKEAGFTTQMGAIQVKAKFNFREMLYHGELAV